MKLHGCLLFLLITSVLAGEENPNPYYLWHQLINARMAPTPASVAADQDENIYTICTVYENDQRVLVSKWNSSGELVKKKILGDENWVYGIALKMNEGRLFVLYSYRGQRGVFTESKLIEMDANLNVKKKQLLHFEPVDFTRDKEGCFYFTGHYQMQIELEDGREKLVLEPKAYNSNFFVIKTDKNFHVQWAQSFSGDIGGELVSICTGGKKVIIAGVCNGNIYHNPDTVILGNKTKDEVETKSFILMLDENGVMSRISGYWNAIIHSILIGKNGSVYACGSFEKNTVFGSVKPKSKSPEQTSFILCADSQLETQWINSFENSGTDSAQSLVFDDRGNIIAAGTFKGTCHFNPADKKTSMQSKEVCLYAVKYAPDGSFIGSNTYTSSDNIALQSSVAGKDVLYLFGNYLSDNSHYLPDENPVPQSDIFLMKVRLKD